MGDVLLHPGNPAWGRELRGFIRTQQKCPACGGGKWAVKDFGRGRRTLVCAEPDCGLGWASLYEVVIKLQGKQLTITHDSKGRRLKTLPDAELVQETVSREIETGKFRQDFWRNARENRFLWENYLKAYLAAERERANAGKISKATYDKRRSLIGHLMAAFVGESLRDVTPGMVDDFCNKRLPLSPKTQHDLLAELQRILTRAWQRNDIEKPLYVHQVTVPKRKPKWMDTDQQDEVLTYVPVEDRPIILFIMDTGCRPGEACALTWEHVDLAKMEITLAQTLSRRQINATTKQRKDNPLPIMENSWFEDYLRKIPRGLPDQPVFKNPQAHRAKNPKGFYTSDYLNKVWKKALETAGFPPFRLNWAGRNSWGNQSLRAGMDTKLIARQFGHSDDRYVKVYVDTDTDVLRKAIKKHPRRKSSLPKIQPISKKN